MLGALSRMKSLIAPPLSSISKASPSCPFFSLASKSKISRLPTIRRNPIVLPLKTPPMLSIFPFPNRCIQSKCFPSSSSGEIHVIIGPMFAGKTTTLLRRMQSETDAGRSVAIIKSNKDTRYCLDSIVTHDGVKLPCVPLSKLSSFKQKIGDDAYEQLNVIGIDEAQFFEDLYDFCREAADHDGKTVVVAGLDGDYLRSVAIIKSNKDTRYCLESIVTHDGVKLPCVPLSKLSSFKQKIGDDAYEQLNVIGIDEAQFFEDLYDFCREAADHDGKTVVVAGLDGDYLRRSFGCVLDIIPIADSVTKLTARCEFCGKRAFFTLRKTEESQVELIGGADVYMPVCRHHYVSGQVVVEAARIVLESSKVEPCV